MKPELSLETWLQMHQAFRIEIHQPEAVPYYMAFEGAHQVSQYPYVDPRPVTREVDTMIDADVLFAHMLWTECRGEPLDGRVAVAQVVMNRLTLAQRHGVRWWGSDLRTILLHPGQFAIADAVPLSVVGGKLHIIAALATRELFVAYPPTFSGLATHFHAKTITPYWAKNPAMRFVGEIGNHRFYAETYYTRG